MTKHNVKKCLFNLKQLYGKHCNHCPVPVDLNRTPVAVPATNVFNSSSAPLVLDNSTPNKLYIRATIEKSSFIQVPI